MEAALARMPTSPLRLAELATRKATNFELLPNATERQAIADALDIPGIKKLRFAGSLSPAGRRDWELTAELGATVVQSCVVTLDPVTNRLDEKVLRRFLAEMPDLDGQEVEMPEDDTVEPLPEILDLYDVLVEALALALPLYPRAEGAELGESVFTHKGGKAMTDEETKPFAGLGALRDSLKNKGD
jgi:uncharacterized metal-binding protein YceD (DUF177 family)